MDDYQPTDWFTFGDKPNCIKVNDEKCVYKHQISFMLITTLCLTHNRCHFKYNPNYKGQNNGQ